MIDKNFIDDLEYQVTGACIEVHRALGPGLLEKVYHKCLIRELQLRNISFVSDQVVTVSYKGMLLDTELRIDLLVENFLVLELKSVEKILPIHEAQILTYMKILRAPKGMIINFNCTNIVQNGKRPFINEYYPPF